MKDIFKGVAIKILSIIVVVGLLAGGVYLAYHHFVGKITDASGHDVENSVEVIKEKLEETAELNTGSYLCTDVISNADSRTFKDWKIPLTEKSFIVQYDGVVKAGIKDLTEAEVTQNGNEVIVKLPDVEITGAEIDNDSFVKLDESNNIFNPISVEDLNEAQKDLKEEMYERAEEKGILNMARENAEVLISGMLESPDGDYEIVIEWE